MASVFRKVVGKTCNQEDCTLQGQTVEDAAATRCEECGRPLYEMTVPHRGRQVLAALLAAVLVAGVGYGALRALRLPGNRPRPAPAEAQLPARPLPPSRPAADSQRQVTAKVREIYRGGEAGPAQKADLAKWLAGNPELVRAYAEVERSRLPHILEACRLLRAGQALVARKELETARADFLKATAEDAENANAWAALGGADMLTRRETEARSAYEHALAVDPDSWSAHYNYGFYFARRGETEAALEHLGRAVSLLRDTAGVDRAAVLEDLRKNPVLEPLRRDPRFERLLG